MALYMGVVCLLLPLAPLLCALLWLGAKSDARRRARFALVIRLDADGDAFVAHLDGGATLRVVPSEVGDVRGYQWGDGINGSEYDKGLLIDGGVRIRADGWSDTLAPLIDALEARNMIWGKWRPGEHPEVRSGWLGGFCFLGLCLDGVIAIVVASFGC